MNCAQHPDVPAAAYCRTCGRPLCTACKRDVQGTVFCEPCLAARINAAPGAAPYTAPAGFAAPAAGPQAVPVSDASPGLALFLGLIPGVGAFYNGQYLKGFVHVIIFSTLIWLGDNGMGAFAGLLTAAWYFYMVFDAWATAKARKYGQPLPDPLGLNAILNQREGSFAQRMEHAGEQIGVRMENAASQFNQHWKGMGAATPGATPGAAPAPGATTTGTATEAQPAAEPGATADPGSASYVGPQGTYYSGPGGTYYSGPSGAYYSTAPGAPAPVPVPEPENDKGPVGAIILIAFGILFLLGNLGWFSFHWIGRAWPAVLILVGLWLFIKRQRPVVR